MSKLEIVSTDPVRIELPYTVFKIIFTTVQNEVCLILIPFVTPIVHITTIVHLKPNLIKLLAVSLTFLTTTGGARCVRKNLGYRTNSTMVIRQNFTVNMSN